MKITIFGAGNLGLACSAVLAGQHDITLYTKRTHSQHEAISLEYEGQERGIADIEVTDDLARACQADLILCTYPAFLRQRFVEDLSPFARPGLAIGFIPGYGGVEYYCQDLITRGVTVFGLQRVPYVSRSSWEDRTAHILSAKDALYAAALPKTSTASIASLVESLFGIPTIALKEFLAITLVPSNPLLHTSGCWGIFKDYREGDSWPEQLMFYEHWTDETSRFLLGYDDELQRICAQLAPLDLSEVVSLRTYYESPTAQDMTRKLKSIKAFEVVKAPMRQQGDGSFVPNWNDRMFVEDFPFGVAIIKDIALMAGVETPFVDELLRFYERNTGTVYLTKGGALGKDSTASAMPRVFGLDSKEKLINFYLR